MSRDHKAEKRLSWALAALQEFLRLEAAGGMILLAMMTLALVLVNSPFASLYDAVLNAPVKVQIGPLEIAKPFLLWINDGLMAVFFLLVSLEIKREMLVGELSSPRRFTLPALAALGGMAVPAGFYLLFNNGLDTARGWAVPSATDIAFSLGVLSVLGSRVPVSLKVFLAALAILDDLGAIVVIAVFYTSDLSVLSLSLAGLALAVLLALNRRGVANIAPYALVTVFLWVCVLKSGVHATLAGVAMGFAVPLRASAKEAAIQPLRHLEHVLHPWVAYLILPVFAFANSGLPLGGLGLSDFTSPVFLGIALGLFLGKQIGVFAMSWLAVKLNLARMPEGATWAQLYAVSILTGIGFTMSLFIGGLAFDGMGAVIDSQTRLGVLTGSVASALAGIALLAALCPRREKGAVGPG